MFDFAAARRELRLPVTGRPPNELAAGLRALAALRSALDACEARVLAEFAASGAWKGDGAADAAAWLRDQTRVSARDAAGRVAAAEVLSNLPRTVTALADGEITAEHATAIARAAQRSPAIAGHEASLLAHAARQSVDGFGRTLRRVEQVVSADGGASQALRQHQRRSVTATTIDDGMTLLQARLDPIAAATVLGRLDRIAEELWRTDSGEARAVELHVRRADALVEMARRAGAVDPSAMQRPEPTIVAVIDHRHLLDQLATAGVCQLDDGNPIPPATARRLACSAGILPAVLGGASVPLDWGRTRRLASPTQRQALVVRDGGCVFPGCDRPHAWCDAHHLTPYPNGPTNLDNLASLCDAHHHLVHEGRWALRRLPDGGWTVRSPDGIEHHRPARTTSPDPPAPPSDLDQLPLGA
jgi:hypothetical protein